MGEDMARGTMFVAVTVAFAAGFGGYLGQQSWSRGVSIGSLLVPTVVCDVTEDLCRDRMRSEAELAFRAGDEARGVAVLRRLTRLGDRRAMFDLGWHHEEVYRAAVGSALAAGVPIREAVDLAPEDLPGGDRFEALVDARLPSSDGASRIDDARALAYLWYARAAGAGFAPAINNLATLFWSGIVGGRDELAARRWYLKAYDAGSPVAAFNLEAMRGKHYADAATECLEQAGAGWLPLVMVPAADDMKDSVLERTRFRGKPLDRAFRVLVKDMVLRVTDPEAWMREAVASPLERRLSSWSGRGGDVVFDDEDPATRNALPTFEERVAEDRRREGRRGACSAHQSPDPRDARIRAETERFTEQFLRVRALQDGGRRGGGGPGAGAS